MVAVLGWGGPASIGEIDVCRFAVPARVLLVSGQGISKPQTNCWLAPDSFVLVHGEQDLQVDL
jgi:hypothetical protein